MLGKKNGVKRYSMSNAGAKGFMRNSANRVSNYAKSAGSVVTALVSVFLVLVVGLIIYWIYQAVGKSKQGDADNPILIDGSINAFDSKNTKSWTLPESANSNSPSMAFTYSFWMYIADWNYQYGTEKVILYKGNQQSGANPSPRIALDATENTLHIKMTDQSCSVRNIPLQKWVHVAYVLDNRVSDVYINGKLERSCILPGVPRLNNADLVLLPGNTNTSDITSKSAVGFYGQLASVRYFSSALQPTDVARLYNQGPHVTKGLATKDSTSDAGSGGGACPSVYDDASSYLQSLESSGEATLNKLKASL